MRLTVGRIGRAHGIRGYVMVGVRTDEPELRFAVGSRLDTDPAAAGPLTVAAARWQSGDLVVRFEGVRDRTAAEALRGTWLSVDSSTLAPLPDPDEFRDHDLIGLAVRTVSGAPVGEVTDVLHYGQDLLVIGSASGPGSAPGSGPGSDLAPASGLAQGSGPGSGLAQGSGLASGSAPEVLVPFVKAIVTEVDLASGTLVIDPPPGLFNPGETVLCGGSAVLIPQPPRPNTPALKANCVRVPWQVRAVRLAAGGCP